LLGCQYVDPHVDILSHDRDFNIVDFHETALFQFFLMLWTKVEERSSEKEGRKEKDRSFLTFIRGNVNVFSLHL